MDWWNLFWNAFGAIGGTVGALATAAAVIVALWQVKYANKKKLKIEFSDNVTIVPAEGDFSSKKEYVGITVTNIGNRRIKIQHWGIAFPDDRQPFIFLSSPKTSNALSSQWPLVLEPEEQSSQYLTRAYFYTLIRDEAPKCSKKKSPLRFLVSDSTGKQYFVKSKKTLLEYQSEAEAYFASHTERNAL